MLEVFFSLLMVLSCAGTHSTAERCSSIIEVVDTGEKGVDLCTHVSSQPVQPGTEDEVVQIFQDSVVPDAKSSQDSNGAMALVDA